MAEKKNQKRYRAGFWAKLKKIHYEDLYVDLDTYTRVILRDNDGEEVGYEYACHRKELRNRDRPANAVHVTGAKSSVAEVQMEQRYPVFDLVDEFGNPLPDHNDFDAQGYNTFAKDDRLDKAEASLDYKGQSKKMELQKYATFAIVAIVVVAVVAWFVTRG